MFVSFSLQNLLALLQFLVRFVARLLGRTPYKTEAHLFNLKIFATALIRFEPVFPLRRCCFCCCCCCCWFVVVVVVVVGWLLLLLLLPLLLLLFLCCCRCCRCCCFCCFLLPLLPLLLPLFLLLSLLFLLFLVFSLLPMEKNDGKQSSIGCSGPFLGKFATGETSLEGGRGPTERVVFARCQFAGICQLHPILLLI